MLNFPQNGFSSKNNINWTKHFYLQNTQNYLKIYFNLVFPSHEMIASMDYPLLAPILTLYQPSEERLIIKGTESTRKETLTALPPALPHECTCTWSPMVKTRKLRVLLNSSLSLLFSKSCNFNSNISLVPYLLHLSRATTLQLGPRLSSGITVQASPNRSNLAPMCLHSVKKVDIYFVT